MTYRFKVNQTMTDGASAMFEWMSFMTKSNSAPSPGPGWTMVASSDGYGINNGNPTNTTKTYQGQNWIPDVATLKGYKSWFVIQAPDGNMQISVQSLSKPSLVPGAANPASWGSFRMKFAPEGFDLSSGTQFKVPSGKTIAQRNLSAVITGHSKAAEIVWEGDTSSDSNPQANDWFGAGPFRMHMMANDSDGYGFYFFTVTPGTSNIKSVAVLDPMLSGSCPTEDMKQFVLYGKPTSKASQIFDISSMSSSWNQNKPYLYEQGAFFNYGLANETFAGVGVAAPCLKEYTRGYQTPLVGRMPSNPHTGKDDIFPVMWVKPDLGLWGNDPKGRALYSGDGWPNIGLGYKGISSMLKLVSTSRGNLSTLSVASAGDKIVLNDFCLPWNGSTPTI